jgi:pyruvate dehydrogenase phosphatase
VTLFSGYATSSKLRQALIPYVYSELEAVHALNPSGPDAKSIYKAIASAFMKLDENITYKSVDKVLVANSWRLASHILSPAISGSCALLAFYDTRSQLFRVACTGDSRAVLGRKNENGLWTATALSVDLTGDNAEEATRLRREHPGEDDVIKNGRIFGGVQLTRAFGDAAYKWSKERSLSLRKTFWANKPKSQIKSPPYMNAEPVITTTKIEPENGDFVVMASDGLWEILSNEEVVGLVGKWPTTEYGMNEKPPTKGWLQRLTESAHKLPVVESPLAARMEQDLEPDVEPHRPDQWGIKRRLSQFVSKTATLRLI